MDDTANNTDNAAPVAETAAAAAPAPAPARTRAPKAEPTITATLKRGENYAAYHQGRVYRFKQGVPVTIPASLKARLDEHAKDTVTISHGDGLVEGEDRAKFTFA